MWITLRTVSVCLFSQWTVRDVELVDQGGDYTENGKCVFIFTMGGVGCGISGSGWGLH